MVHVAWAQVLGRCVARVADGGGAACAHSGRHVRSKCRSSINEGTMAAKTLPPGSLHVRCTPMRAHSTCGEPNEIKKATHTTRTQFFMLPLFFFRNLPIPRYGPFNCIYGFSQGASVATMVAHASNDAALSSRLSQAPRKSKVPYAWRRLPCAPPP